MDMIIGRRDTIAAIATPAGAGGIGVIRISGPRAADILGTLLAREPASFPDRQLVHGTARDPAGHRLDDVLAVVMRGPRSFTGEDVAEVHGHGGVMNMARLLRATIALGARHAEAGEFTRRAFENGKLDLTRAEAILDVIEASSERAWRLAQAQLDGTLGRHVSGLRSRATDLLAEVEACIDFPEEGEDYLDDLGIKDKARALAEDIDALANTFTLGRALRDGIEVAIVGDVNAGKSSLFNALLTTERAIVDESPGTTRDYVEASVVWDGIAVTLIDTAGDRTTENRVESQGIARGRERAAQADLQLRLHSVENAPQLDESEDGGGRGLDVFTKSDLLDDEQRERLASDSLLTSVVTGDGLDALRRAILDRVCGVQAEGDDGHVVTSERHRSLLQQSATALRRLEQGVGVGQPTEVLAIEARDATRALAELTGERVGEEVLDSLFRRFCIGK